MSFGLHGQPAAGRTDAASKLVCGIYIGRIGAGGNGVIEQFSFKTMNYY
ncbi:hypothetical protein Q644_07205 [Brucella intermedia 229E]|uniref:Uncharacterized protein n=1 Tax=Brucella intermedia 229E TaxID=1337887 RepID=U4V261_9HYPH|nr:hypothetical protein Q644_07205 [Brucella intermedia 229E]